MSLRRLVRHHPRVAITAAGAAIAFASGWLTAAPAALGDRGLSSHLFAGLASAGIVASFCGPLHAVRGPRQRRASLLVAGAALLVGLGAFVLGDSLEQRCTVNYGQGVVVIGTELTPTAAIYKEMNPGLSNEDMLFDAAGDVQRVWTTGSVDRCRTLLATTYFLWIPCLLACLVAIGHVLLFAGLSTLPATRPAIAAAPGSAPPIRYDVFISYRHGAPDADVAREMDERLRAFGYQVAIDERDFAANAHFLSEMERAIRESRFTVAIVSARYLNSGNCEEEAIVCKVLDMGDRRRRLIPFIIEQIEMPAWLYSLVGIDCTKTNALVEPFDKLRETLGEGLQSSVLGPQSSVKS